LQDEPPSNDLELGDGAVPREVVLALALLPEVRTQAMNTSTVTKKKLWAFGRNSFTEKRYAKYVGMAAGSMRGGGVKIPREIPNAALFGDDFGFSWQEVTEVRHPKQRRAGCSHLAVGRIAGEPTKWQLESGNLPVECIECGWTGTTHLWGHSGHRIKGTRELCKICERESK
jgi:hypothetical protein